MIKLHRLTSSVHAHLNKPHVQFSSKIVFMAKMHINLGGSRKRKRGDQIYRFDSFCEPGQPAHFNGTFQENIEALFGHGHMEVSDHEGMKFRSFQLELHRHPQTILRLFIVEELVGMSLYRRCHYCCSAGIIL